MTTPLLDDIAYPPALIRQLGDLYRRRAVAAKHDLYIARVSATMARQRAPRHSGSSADVIV
jgi:hypothetical protein